MTLRRALASSDLPAAVALRGERGVRQGRDYRGVPVVFVSAPVPGTSWAMIGKIDEMELYAPIRRQTLLALLVVFTVVVATIFVGSTIWERRVASLRAKLNLQGIALEAVANSVIMTLPDGTIEWVNPAFTALTGYLPEEVIGKKPSILKSGKEDGSFYQQLWATVLAGQTWHGEMVNRRRDGTLYNEEMTITPVRDARGRIAHFVGIKQNVTQRKETERALALLRNDLEEVVAQRTEQLKKSVEELEHFSYSITHDMRAPLRAMNTYAAMLEQKLGALLSGESQEYVGNIRSAAVRLDNLIRDSLNYSKVLRIEMPLYGVDLGRLLRGIIDTYPNLHSPGVTISIGFQTLEVRGNESALTQCFSNLLGNAVKFVAPGVQPEIRITAEEVTSSAGLALVRVSVSDNGIGIPEDARLTIFQMFMRLHGPSEYPGTGIGLAIVAKVVKRMNGTFGVKSSEGNGSSFWIELEKATHDHDPSHDPTG